MTLETTQHWVRNPLLEEVMQTLGRAVVGHRNVYDEIIGDHGIGSNCAEAFENDVFALRDYCWCDGSRHLDDHIDPDEFQYPIVSGGDGYACPVNFHHFKSGIKGIWYKHLGRSTLFNRNLSAPDTQKLLMDCINSLSTSNIPHRTRKTTP